MYIERQLDAAYFEIRHGTQPDPAVASGFNLLAPENCRSELLALSFTMVTDANAANRYVKLEHILGTNPILIAGALQPHTTGLTVLYGFSIVGTYQAAASTGLGIIALPIYPAIFETDSLKLSINGVQVGDQVSNIAYVWRRWLVR